MLLGELPAGHAFRVDGFEYFKCSGVVVNPDINDPVCKVFKFVPCAPELEVEPLCEAKDYEGCGTPGGGRKCPIKDVEAGWVFRMTNGLVGDLVATKADAISGRMCGECTTHLAMGKAEDVEDLGPVSEYFGPEQISA
jgi:hypothetical protein